MTANGGGHKRLLTFVRRRAGDNLRAVVSYGPDDHEVRYARDGVDTAEVTAVVDHYRGAWQDELRLETGTSAGSHRATLRLYGEAVVVHLPERPRRGVVVALDTAAATAAASFVRECRTRLDADDGSRVDVADGSAGGGSEAGEVAPESGTDATGVDADG